VNKIITRAELSAALKADAQRDSIANQNKELAVTLAKAGIPVFLCKSEDKTPLPIAWEQLDTTIPPEEREARRRKYVDDKGREPQHIGCTLNTELIRKWFRENKTALPAISCGPARLYVVDNDKKFENEVLVNDGVELFDAFCEPHGGLPEGAFFLRTPRGGRHVYFDGADTASLGCRRGSLTKSKYETDLKGTGGYVLAPSAIRATDGKSYGSKADFKAFLAAYKAKKLAPVPRFIRDAIGTAPEGSDLNVTAEELKQPMKDLAEKDWPEYAETFGELALDAKYDIAALMQKDSELREVMESPKGNRSDDRWKMARRLLFLCPDMLVVELATFYGEHADIAGELTDDGVGQGNYSHKDIAKEWVKNRKAAEKGEVKTPSSNGEAMGAIEDEPAKRVSDQPLFSYIEDMRVAEPRYLEWAVKHFIARGTTSIVSGRWGTGKTAVYSEIALHVAHGLPYRDRKVTKGVVIYVALENAEDVERRIRQWCNEMEKQGHDVSNGAFVIHRGPCTLYDQRAKATADEKKLIEIANDASEHYGLPVSIIVIDTLSQSITPGNDRDDGSIFTGAMQRIVNATGANVSTLHHPTKAGEAVRGDSALQGNVDTVIEVARAANGRGTIKAGSKFRIGDPAKVKLRLSAEGFRDRQGRRRRRNHRCALSPGKRR
jgi:AAA domain/Bifunctional DNA primase/polymerase, N-terminal